MSMLRTILWLDHRGLSRIANWLMLGETWWLETRLAKPFKDVQTRYIQDGVDAMTDEQWGEWLNRLPTNEFLVLCLQDPNPEPSPDCGEDDDESELDD